MAFSPEVLRFDSPKSPESKDSDGHKEKKMNSSNTVTNENPHIVSERELASWTFVANKKASTMDTDADIFEIGKARNGGSVQLKGGLKILGSVRRYPGFEAGDEIVTSPLVEFGLHHIEEGTTVHFASDGSTFLLGNKKYYFVAMTASGSQVIVCEDDYDEHYVYYSNYSVA